MENEVSLLAMMAATIYAGAAGHPNEPKVTRCEWAYSEAKMILGLVSPMQKAPDKKKSRVVKAADTTETQQHEQEDNEE